MPEIFAREMARLARLTSPPLCAPLSELVLDLEQLRGEAEAGGYRELAAAIECAAVQARRDIATEPSLAA